MSQVYSQDGIPYASPRTFVDQFIIIIGTSRYVSLMAATGFSPLRYPHFLPELLRGGVSNNIIIISNIVHFLHHLVFLHLYML